jgi:hypothetical protein
MNIHRLVSGAIGRVNRTVPISIQRSAGYTTAADGKQVPSYDPAVTVMGRVQSLQYNDIAQLDGLNIQGQKRAVYLNGNWNGIVREDGKGGDILTFTDPDDGTMSTFIVAFVFENWGGANGWVKLCAVRQMS